MSVINRMTTPAKATVRMSQLVSRYAQWKLSFVSQNELRPRTRTSESGGFICIPTRMRRSVDFPDPLTPMRIQQLPVGIFQLRLRIIVVNGLESTTAELSGIFSLITSREISLPCLPYHDWDAKTDGSRRKGAEAQLFLEWWEIRSKKWKWVPWNSFRLAWKPVDLRMKYTRWT